MRSLFIVASKILGILFVYWFLLGLGGLITSIEHMESFGPSFIFRTVFSLLITLILAYLLILKTDPVAERLGLHEDEPISTNLSFDSIVKIGVILIGIYVFTARVGTFLRFIFEYIQKVKAPRSVFAPNWIATTDGLVSTIDVIMQGLVILFSLFLVFESSKVIEIIKKVEKRGT